MTSHEQASCQLCVNAATIGWWGDSNVTHCRECGNTWRRTSRTVECTACHRLFGGHTIADVHANADGSVCKAPEAVGLVSSANQYGCTVWHRPREDWWQR